MSDIFTVVLDLSRVNNDNKGNQMYLAMADTTKMKKICDFKNYIQFLFSLGCSVELFHEDVRLPDLEDIRVLSRLDVVQVRPENIEEKKCEGKKLISKSKPKGCNEEHVDGDPRPMPCDNAANYNYIDSKENVYNFKSLESGKVIQAQEVPGYGDNGKAELTCPSFPAGNRACSTVQKSRDNMMKKMYDMQENKTFRLGETTGMAENLKLAALLQNRYYGWCGKPDSNIATGRSHFQKSNEMPDLKSGEKPCMFKSSGKFSDDDSGVENKPYIPIEGDVNISENTFKGTMWSPVKLKETNNHEFRGKDPPARQISRKSYSRSRPDPHSGPYGSHAVPATVQKPLTSVTDDYREKNSCAEGSFGRKPLTVDEALKILTEVAAERSKTLSGNNPAFHNGGRKNQFKGAFKTFKANPAGGSQNFQKGYFKYQITSRNPATLDKDGTAVVTPDGHNPKTVSCQPHVPKQDTNKSKVNKMAGSGCKYQGKALLKSCEKLGGNQCPKTENTEKFEAKTGAQNKKMCKANMATKTGDKSEGKASVKGCDKTDVNQGGKTESTGKIELETGAMNPLLQCHLTEKKKKSKNKKKAKSESASVSHSSISNCEHFDNSHGNDKVGVAGKTESETAPSNHLVKYGNVKDKMVQNDNFSELSNSESVFLEECVNSSALNYVIKGKDFNGEESERFEKSPPVELNSSNGDSERVVRLPCSGPDNPTGVDTSSKNTSDFQFPGKDTQPDSRGDLQATDSVNTEDESGANVSISHGDNVRDLYPSGGAVAQNASAHPLLDLQGKTIAPNDDNKDKSESHGSTDTNKVISLPNIITDNTSVQYAKGINVSGDGGEGGPVFSKGQAQLTRNHSRDEFRTEDVAALTRAGTGSAKVGVKDSVSCGSCSVPTHISITPPSQFVGSVKTEESQDLHRPGGSGRDTEAGKLQSSPAGSSGKSTNIGRGNDSRSGLGKKECVIC